MSGIIGKKLGMTSVYNENGKNIPCTVIEAGPCYVTQIKSDEVDGYSAVQIGFEEKKEKNTTKALKGHFKKAGVKPLKKLMEFDFKGAENEYKVGDEITADFFNEGEWVDVSGVSKGKGFQGVVKRHGFRGVGQATHGQHNRLRAPGSIGAGSDPSRVFKGMRMAGQMGNERVKVQNLQVVKVLADKNLILLKGAVPGATGAIISIEK